MELMPVVEGGQRVLAAVSGGPDSVALLLLLNDMRLAGDIDLCAAHFNHGIRGSESDGDARFVEELCARLGVALYREKADVPALAKESGEGLETAARRARWEFLLRAREKMNCDAVATAHHMDDQAETVLMHLFRGGGLRGAAGISPRARGVIRPLLGISKAELREFLRERGQDWREDSTNADSDNPRNYLRNEVMPLIAGAYPGFKRALARFADIAAKEDAYMRRETDRSLSENAFVTPYGCALRLSGDEAILRREVARMTRADYEGVIRVLGGFASGEAVEIAGWRVEFAGEFAHFIAEGRKPPGKAVALADGARLEGVGRVRVYDGVSAVISRDPWAQTLDADALSGAVLRTRLPGDTMRPLGCGGSKKLKDILIDRHIPRARRDYMPLVARGKDILWIPGECVCDEVKLTSFTKRAVRLEWEREDMLPWREEC